MLEYIAIRLRALPKTERGATAVEYGLLVALIAAAIVVIVGTLGGKINNSFTKISDKIPTN
ncbi:MAG: Flp family type IVb pilin [Actinomycetota bacterium]